MEIIPVIDILNGIAVHAKGGHRDSYKPLVSCFAQSSDPRTLIDGLLSKHTVGSIYLADLDAIVHNAPNSELCCELAGAHPQVRFIIDAGLKPRLQFDALLKTANIDLVIASETLRTLDEFHAMTARVPAARTFLSLDRKGEECFGPAELFELSGLWPRRVIHMNLGQVGANQGPDWQGLEALSAKSDGRLIYAAGGVRDVKDLLELERRNLAGVLIGSALHDGRLTL